MQIKKFIGRLHSLRVIHQPIFRSVQSSPRFSSTGLFHSAEDVATILMVIKIKTVLGGSLSKECILEEYPQISKTRYDRSIAHVPLFCARCGAYGSEMAPVSHLFVWRD